LALIVSMDKIVVLGPGHYLERPVLVNIPDVYVERFQ